MATGTRTSCYRRATSSLMARLARRPSSLTRFTASERRSRTWWTGSGCAGVSWRTQRLSTTVTRPASTTAATLSAG
uniref:Uncharacterized 8.2 kDa protein in mobL 3'region n=1 Tax=Acidithiobacillus ferridurans TaxID=1232575 RepID=YML1_ACIFI|nr:RecName: Full=Uncharacterized 8.2 kDa protein in mobL 3'region; AltName: Full=ORF 3 [Acidithiobacillus ferridurans]CAA36928.1 unnamed protein product [Acidithiobacillus ferridurans]